MKYDQETMDEQDLGFIQVKPPVSGFDMGLNTNLGIDFGLDF